MLRLMRFVTVVSTGLLAGLLLDFWLFVAPVADGRLQEQLAGRYAVAAPVLYAVVNLSAVALLVLLWRRSGPAFLLTTAGVLFAAMATAVTLLVNVPINAGLLGSQDLAPAADWALANTVRAGLMLAAFACQVAAVLSSPRPAM